MLRNRISKVIYFEVDCSHWEIFLRKRLLKGTFEIIASAWRKSIQISVWNFESKMRRLWSASHRVSCRNPLAWSVDSRADPYAKWQQSKSLNETRSIWKMLGPFATASRFTLSFTRCRYCRTPPAHRCPRQRRQRQRQRVTEGTATAP